MKIINRDSFRGKRLYASWIILLTLAALIAVSLFYLSDRARSLEPAEAIKRLLTPAHLNQLQIQVSDAAFFGMDVAITEGFLNELLIELEPSDWVVEEKLPSLVSRSIAIAVGKTDTDKSLLRSIKICLSEKNTYVQLRSATQTSTYCAPANQYYEVRRLCERYRYKPQGILSGEYRAIQLDPSLRMRDSLQCGNTLVLLCQTDTSTPLAATRLIGLSAETGVIEFDQPLDMHAVRLRQSLSREQDKSFWVITKQGATQYDTSGEQIAVRSIPSQLVDEQIIGIQQNKVAFVQRQVTADYTFDFAGEQMAVATWNGIWVGDHPDHMKRILKNPDNLVTARREDQPQFYAEPYFLRQGRYLSVSILKPFDARYRVGIVLVDLQTNEQIFLEDDRFTDTTGLNIYDTELVLQDVLQYTRIDPSTADAKTTRSCGPIWYVPGQSEAYLAQNLSRDSQGRMQYTLYREPHGDTLLSTGGIPINNVLAFETVALCAWTDQDQPQWLLVQM